MKSEQCSISGHSLQISKEIKVLGCWLDEQITGEAQCMRAAGKAMKAAGAIKRSSKYLPLADRDHLIKATSHPHMHYCQNALYNPSKGALEYLEKAYNRSGRMITNLERTAPALEKLGWPALPEIHRRKQAEFVMSIFKRRQPEVLQERLPGPLQGSMETRAIARGELWEPPATPGIGEKTFGVWAPRIINEELRRQGPVPR